MIGKRTKRRLSLLAVLMIAALIFCFSAQPGKGSSTLSEKVATTILSVLMPGFRDMPPQAQQSCLERWNHIIRKCAHFSEYALLAMALTNYLRYRTRRGNEARAMLIAWAVATVYACTDEAHQMFVAERTAELTDICIDSAGALFGALIAFACLRLLKRRRRKG